MRPPEQHLQQLPVTQCNVGTAQTWGSVSLHSTLDSIPLNTHHNPPKLHHSWEQLFSMARRECSNKYLQREDYQLGTKKGQQHQILRTYKK